MSQNINWVLKLDVNPGKNDDAQTLMHEMVASTEANEPGTLSYEWNFNADKSSLHTCERYDSSESTMAHLGNFGANFAERFMQCFTPTGFTVYGNASDELREALAAFGPEFYTPDAGFAR